MESLVRQLLEKAGSEGGEVWLHRCLELMDGREEQPGSSGAGFLPEEEVRTQLRSSGLRGVALAQHE